MEAVKLSSVVQQRLEAQIAAGIGGLDLADEDRVIARRIRVDSGALDLRERILQDREPHDALPIARALEFLGPAGRGREAAGDLLVIEMQDVDREAPVSEKGLIALCRVSDADQDQRRIEGHGRDGAGGETGWLTRAIPRGDHGDAGGEMPQHPSEIVSA